MFCMFIHQVQGFGQGCAVPFQNDLVLACFVAMVYLSLNRLCYCSHVKRMSAPHSGPYFLIVCLFVCFILYFLIIKVETWDKKERKQWEHWRKLHCYNVRSRILPKICGYNKTPPCLLRHAMYFKYVRVIFSAPRNTL